MNSSRGDTSLSELQKMEPGGSSTALGKASRLGSICSKNMSSQRNVHVGIGARSGRRAR